MHEPKMQKLIAKNYKRLFEVQNTPFWISDVFSYSYRKLLCLLVYYKQNWTVYLPNRIISKTLKEGKSLFKDEIRFNKYLQGFDCYICNSKKINDKLLASKTLTQSNLSLLFSDWGTFHSYYQKTEFYFTESAVLMAEQAQVIKNNLLRIERVKNLNRDYLNKIFFGSKCYISLAMRILSYQFKITEEELHWFGMNDLLNLFDGKKLAGEVINNRKLAYLMVGNGKNFQYSEGEEAQRWISDFLLNSKSPKILKGLVASKGICSGRVKIIPADYRNFDQINQIIDEMNIGDILVAETTSPELTPACQKAGAIVTNQGGSLSHAAIISRELGIPCVVGTQSATKILKDGDYIEVDAINGLINFLHDEEKVCL